MRKCLFILLLISNLFLLKGYSQENKKMWTEGDISWSDFNNRMDKNNPYYFYYNIQFVPERRYQDDVKIIAFKASCYMNKDSSWVNPLYKDDLTLNLFQNILNIVELHTRDLQLELDKGYSSGGDQSLLYRTYNKAKEEIKVFLDETNYGHNKEAYQEWNDYIHTKLFETNISHPVSFRKGYFGYGMYIGTGMGIYTSSLGKHFSPSIILNYGFDFSYKKSFLMISADLAWNKLKQDLETSVHWGEGNGTNFALGNLSYGYAFWERKKFRVIPFIGYGFMEFSDQSMNQEGEVNPFLLQRSGPIVGINTDFILRKRLNLFRSSYLGNEYVETNIKAKITIGKANYQSDLEGLIIHLTFGISGFGNMAKILNSN